MEVVREKAQELLEAIGYENAGTWKETSKIRRMLNKFDELKGADAKVTDAKLEKLRKKILSALSDEEEIDVVSGEEPESKPKPTKVPESTKVRAQTKETPQNNGKSTRAAKTTKSTLKTQEDEEEEGEEEKEDKKVKKETSTSEKGKRTEVFGHSITTVARWMGREGWNKAEAQKAFEELGKSDGIAESTLNTCLSYGRRGDTKFGAIAELTEADARKLYKAAEKKFKKPSPVVKDDEEDEAPEKTPEKTTKKTKPKSGKVIIQEEDE